ncbi:MAG: acetate/propionate family kinase [Pseudomonadota bacterium]
MTGHDENTMASHTFCVLVINAGSSSVKFGIFDTAANRQLFKSEVERTASVEDAIREIPRLLKTQGIAPPDAIGHRVAHGGAKFRDACVIDPDVIQGIEECVPLAPLHNPPALAGIKVAGGAWPGVPQVAVFDTAFHQTIPERATTYAVPRSWREAGLRRYGFHGTSHKYVMLRVAEELKTPATELRIVSCHLGNGASVCAIERGASVDTSMGMTALEGLVMGTRSGDVDPGIFAHLHRTLDLSAADIEHALYHESGLAALSALGNDMRDIEKRAAEGDKQAQLAIQVYAYRVRKYIGAYAAAMSGVDVIAFTGGIGENSPSMRRRILSGFEFLGLAIDDDRNAGVRLTGSEAPQIQRDNSRVRVIVTQTREQWMIAQEAARVLALKKMPVRSLPPIPVAVSAHHVHLTQAAVEQLFGKGHQLRIRNPLRQPGFWAAEETVDVIGPRGEIPRLRVLGPCRTANQIEIAETEAYKLGIDVPVRLSGNTTDTPVVTLRGPKGSIRTEGLIVAKRHIHMNTQDAQARGLKHGDQVEVAVRSDGRDLVFRDVVIRTDPEFVTEMHIDTDEANAAHLKAGGAGELVSLEGCSARITDCRSPADGLGKSCCLDESQDKVAA